jgi:hypothetical protein
MKYRKLAAVALITPVMSVNAFGGVIGDVNNDGAVTAEDAAVTLQACLNGDTLENADVDNSGNVTSNDAASILKMSMENNIENYDILVDNSIEESQPENNIYKTVQEAYNAAPEGTEDNPTVIKIEPGVYLMNGDDKENGLGIYKNYLTFIGDSTDANDIVFADNRGNNQGASGNWNSASVVSNCTGLVMKNISIYNYCNIDVPFAKDPSQALTKRSSLETQAFAYIGLGDKHIYENCQFISILDTMSCDARSYFKDCYVQGTNDFMGGSGVQYWENSTINSLSNHIVGGGNKIVFDGCTFQLNKPEGSLPTYFCKGWTTLTLLNCTVPTEKGKYQWTPTLPTQYMFGYYNCKNNNGEAIDVTGNDSCAMALTDEQAQAYNVWNVLRGDDNWDPTGSADKYADKGSEPMYVSTDESLTVKTGEASGKITASVYPARADQSVTFTAEGDISIEQSGNTCTVTSTNTSLDVTTATIIATASNGVKNKTVVTVQPKVEDAPTFAKQAEIVAPADGVISVDYDLDLGVASQDQSLISWYRCDDADGSNPVIIADSKMNEPTKSYSLCTGDIGKYIKVTITPKSELSNTGESVSLIYPVAIDKTVINTNISTNFQSVPTHPPFITSDELASVIDNGDGTTTSYRSTLEKSIEGTVAGKWNFIGDWWYNYGAGTYGEKVKGIITGTRYGRVIYKQDGNYFDKMTAVVSLTPEKTAGQAFGSAGQYQEILIKYDPDTQTGYGVRYTRSSSATNTVDFQLYQYINGVGTPIGEVKSMTSTFRSNCTITLSMSGTSLSAKIETDYTTGEEATPVDPVELSGTVTADISDRGFGGFEIYHQGSTGGRFVITNVELNYD